jgi:hypothetical protein
MVFFKSVFSFSMHQNDYFQIFLKKFDIKTIKKNILKKHLMPFQMKFIQK